MFDRRIVVAVLVLAGLVLFSAGITPAQQATKPKDTYILKGAPIGGVKFDHKTQIGRAHV